MSLDFRKGGSRALRVVCRSSELSLIQVEEVFRNFPNINYTVNAQESFGDKNKDISLMSKEVSQDFFTREMDNAILSGSADIAIHSAKDLPYPIPEGLEVIALFEAFDKTDSLVSKTGETLSQLPAGARIGTSSPTRRSELMRLRPDLEVVSIRGTIGERVEQVESGFVDALIVATCAMMRLNMADKIAERLPFKTHPLQGNIAITAKNGSSLHPLFASKDIGRRLLVTGTTCDAYKDLGFVTTHQPLIRISEMEDKTAVYKGVHEILYKAPEKLGDSGSSWGNWVVFTSRYGVRYFFESLSVDMIEGIKIASVGSVTSAELLARGFTPTIESPTESAEGLVKYFIDNGICDSKVLLPRSAIGLKYLSEELSRLGNTVIDIAVYNNSVNMDVDKLDLSLFDRIAFASPSAIKAFVQIYGKIPEDKEFILKGKTTEDFLKKMR